MNHEDTLPTTSSGLDAYLSEAMEETQEEAYHERAERRQEEHEVTAAPEEDELTLYGTYLIAVEGALSALDEAEGTLPTRGKAFYDFLTHLRDKLIH